MNSLLADLRYSLRMLAKKPVFTLVAVITIIGQGMKLSITGVVIGLLASFGLTRFMKEMLYGVKPVDPLTFIAIAMLLSATAIVACYIPARRATEVDPMIALRCE